MTAHIGGVQSSCTSSSLSELFDVRQLDNLFILHSLLAELCGPDSPAYTSHCLTAYAVVLRIWQVRRRLRMYPWAYLAEGALRLLSSLKVKKKLKMNGEKLIIKNSFCYVGTTAAFYFYARHILGMTSERSICCHYSVFAAAEFKLLYW